MSVHQTLNLIAIVVSVVVPLALLFQWESFRIGGGELALAAELDERDDRVVDVVQKLRSRGRIVLANRIAGAHKRWMDLTEFDEEVKKIYVKAQSRRHSLMAQRLAAAYGGALVGEERGFAS